MVVNVPRAYDKNRASPVVHRSPVQTTASPSMKQQCGTTTTVSSLATMLHSNPSMTASFSSSSADHHLQTAANLSNERFLMNLFLQQQQLEAQVAATRSHRGDRYAAIDEPDDVPDESCEADSPRVSLPRNERNSATNCILYSSHNSNNGTHFISASNLAKSRTSVESYEGSVHLDDDDDDGTPDESRSRPPSDVEEDIEGLEIGSDDSSAAADDSDVECSFQKLSMERNDIDGDGDASPPRERPDFTKSDCPLQEIRPLLEATDEHPFLSLEDQIAAVANHRAQCLYDFCTSMTNQAALNPDDQAVAAKILVNEAHRLQAKRHASQVPVGAIGGMGMLPSHLRSTSSLPSKMPPSQRRVMWERVGNNVARDLYVEGHSFVQRRLSCMCIFSVTKEDRMYHDNDSERMQRLARQERLLAEIKLQAMQGGNKYFYQASSESA